MDTHGADVSVETEYDCIPAVSGFDETDVAMDMRYYASYDSILMLDPITRTWSTVK